MSGKCSIIVFVIACVGLSILLASLHGHVRFRYQALELDIRASFAGPGPGVTRVVVPPIGRIDADTHRGPLSLTVSLRNIDLDTVPGMVASSRGVASLADGLKGAVRDVFPRFAAALLVLGMAGGLLAGLIFGLRSPKWLALACWIGVIPVAAGLGLAAATYDVGAFSSNPRYFGVIEAAPWMLGSIDEGANHVEQLSLGLQRLTENLSSVYRPVHALGPLADDSHLRVLHVSDIHNNPAGHDFAARLAAEFGVSAVIDTGDLTDLGTVLEGNLADRIRGLGVPYFFVPGNHDSPSVVDRIRKIPNVTVLEGSPVSFRGLTILGFPDPASHTANSVLPTRAELKEISDSIVEAVTRSREPVDIVAVHNEASAGGAVGAAPVILCGHDHKVSVKEQNGSVMINAGTTGAAGLRGLSAASEPPYTLALLHFEAVARPDEGAAPRWRLVAVDTVEVSRGQSGFVVRRVPVGR
ncbi:MAG: metallophosphoesterase [Firmicutes bacterium]|nr:metallophosphoesterase [Bacillota bacterium]